MTDTDSTADQYDSRDYPKLDLAAMIEQHGIAYGGYHRLKVSALTDEIAEYVARVSRFNEQSDEFQAIRHLVAAWRDRHYVPYLSDEMRTRGIESENLFTLRYDLNFRIRRLSFVLGRCDLLLGASETELTRMLGHRGLRMDAGQQASAAFENTLREVRQALSHCIGRLRELRLSLLARDGSINPIGTAVSTLSITREDMLGVLAPPTVGERVAAAVDLLDRRKLWTAMDDIAGVLASVIAGETVPASQACSAQLPPPPISIPEPSDTAAVGRAILRWYYWDYERYDQLIFPAYFSTEVGEEMTIVDVLRVSPEDAPSLIDEGAASEPRRKLAGNALMHFGAFLDRRWRWNDIMWGRLDGAERLITGLLSGTGADRHALRCALLAEVHGAILEDELRKPEAEPMTWATTAERNEINRLLELSADAPYADRLAARERVRRIFTKSYRTPPGPTAEASVKIAARATRVVGQMLDAMTEQYTLLKQPAAWLTRIGGLAWGIVEVAVPQSMRNLMATHAFKLLYTLEALLVGIGIFVNGTIRNFGIQLFMVTVAGHVTVLLLRDLFSDRISWMRRVVGVAAVAAAATATAGGFALINSALRTQLLAQLAAPGGPVRFTLAFAGVFAGVLLALRIGAAKFWHRLVASPENASVREGTSRQPRTSGRVSQSQPLRGTGYDRRSGGLAAQRTARDVEARVEERKP